MKKQNSLTGFGLSVAVSVTFLLPKIGVSEYGDYSSSLNDLSKDTSKVEDVLNSNGALSGSEESFQEKIKKSLKKAQALLKTDKLVAEEREKVLNWSQKNDQVKNLIALPDVLMQKALKSRETDLNSAEGFLSALGKKSSNVNPQDFSMNGMPKSCRNGVDFTQFMSLTEQLGSEPFQYLQGEARNLLEEKSEDLKKKQAQKISDIIKYFKELANKESSDGEIVKLDEEKQKAKTPKSIEAHLEKLKAINKNKKEENKELKNSVVDVFGKFIGDLGSLQKNDKRVHQLADEFAKSIENSQRAAMMTAQQNVDQLFTNCESEVKTLKVEIENFKAQLVSRGWDPAVAEADAQAQRARAQNMQCTDVTQNVQSLLMGFGTGGSALSDRLTQIRAEKNPTKMLSLAVSTMQDVANIQQQVGQQLRPLMEDCEQAGLGREGVKQRFAQLQGGQGGAPGASTGDRNSQARRNGTNGSPTTHLGAVR